MKYAVLGLTLALTCPLRTIDAAENGVESVALESTEALVAALNAPQPPARIQLRRGVYLLDRGLTLPDNTTLIGAGVMRFDADGIPEGFEPGSETILEVSRGFDDNVVTLGNRASIRALVLRDIEDGKHGRRSGNVVVVQSRAANERLDASIVACEIESPNRAGFTDAGPSGHGILVMTRNPLELAPRVPHEGATVVLRVEDSIVRASPPAAALFAINFATRGKIAVALTHNRVAGELLGTGAANRPDLVSHAALDIESHQNFYSMAGGTSRAWVLLGASSPPHHKSHAATGPAFNSLRVRSIGDRIEGASVAVYATAARRLSTSGPVSDNVLELDLNDLTLRTEGPDAADLRLFAAIAEPIDGAGPVGERNALRVRMNGSTGSGRRANTYDYDVRLSNRIEFSGDAGTFMRSNTQIDPAPPIDTFVPQP